MIATAQLAEVEPTLRTGLDLPSGFLDGVRVLDDYNFGPELYRASGDATKQGLDLTPDYLPRGFLAFKMYLTAMQHQFLVGGRNPGDVRMTPSADLDLVFEACVVLNLRWEGLCRGVFGTTVYHMMEAVDPEPLAKATQTGVRTLFQPDKVPWEFFEPGRRDCRNSCNKICCFGMVGPGMPN